MDRQPDEAVPFIQKFDILHRRMMKHFGQWESHQLKGTPEANLDWEAYMEAFAEFTALVQQRNESILERKYAEQRSRGLESR
jgi:hypothetical protein